MKIELMVWSDGEEYNAEITGFYGSFGACNGVGIAQLLGAQNPYTEHITRHIEHEPYAAWTVMAEVKYVEPEVQYGTGFGDTLTLPGYYQIGNIISTERHPEEDAADLQELDCHKCSGTGIHPRLGPDWCGECGGVGKLYEPKANEPTESA